MKISSSFDNRSRRRSKAPLVWGVVLIIFVALLVMLWRAGGEQPQKPVEKVIPVEQLGK